MKARTLALAALAALMVGGWAPPLRAQWREPEPAGPPALAALAPERGGADGCPTGCRAAVGAVGGAAGGWLLFTFTVGILAAGHDAEYRRIRARFVVGGALIGAFAGAVARGS